MDLRGNNKILKLYIRDVFVFFQIFILLIAFPGVPEVLASVSYIGSGTANVGNNTIINISQPTGTQRGDLMIMNLSAGATTLVLTPGWTRIGRNTNTQYSTILAYAIATTTSNTHKVASVSNSICGNISTI